MSYSAKELGGLNELLYFTYTQLRAVCQILFLVLLHSFRPFLLMAMKLFVMLFWGTLKTDTITIIIIVTIIIILLTLQLCDDTQFTHCARQYI